MTKCEICNRELINGEFEEKLGICVNCIMIESREDSYKSLLIILLIVLGWVMFIVALLGVIFIVSSLFISYGANFSYLIPPLTLSIIIGPGLIYFTVFHKFK